MEDKDVKVKMSICPECGKECAFVLIDEIINLMHEVGNKPEFTKKYWLDVKQEIEKL